MKLNRLQRIGVVLSVLWMLCAAIYVRASQINAAQLIIDNAYKVCIENGEWDFATCLTRAQGRFHDAYTLNPIAVMDIAIAMVLPILVAWPLTWVVIKIYRWVMAG